MTATTAPDAAFRGWQDLALRKGYTLPEDRCGLIVPNDPKPCRACLTLPSERW